MRIAFHNVFACSFVQDGVLHIRPTLTAERFGEDFLYNGTLDLTPECNVNWNGGCVVYGFSFFALFIHRKRKEKFLFYFTAHRAYTRVCG